MILVTHLFFRLARYFLRILYKDTEAFFLILSGHINSITLLIYRVVEKLKNCRVPSFEQ